MAYKLELPPSSSIHDVFYILQLKKALGNQHSLQPQLPPISDDYEWIVEPDEVLGIHWNEELLEEEWLVKWRDKKPCEASWESAADIRLQFPEFHLEDKVYVTLEVL